MPADRHSSSVPHTMLLAQNAYLLEYAAAAMVGDHSLEQGWVLARTLALKGGGGLEKRVVVFHQLFFPLPLSKSLTERAGRS